ncbi:unnamed protein product [Ilex paraguariensis]|uniref:Uncharacterized protein n=1 Tax=Ilex paraguariensis TaxID=185542 RepID=A0ABC8SYH0_9AQUA
MVSSSSRVPCVTDCIDLLLTLCQNALYSSRVAMNLYSASNVRRKSDFRWIGCFNVSWSWASRIISIYLFCLNFVADAHPDPSFSLAYACEDVQNYFAGVQHLRGEALKEKLYSIIAKHQSISYREVWDAIKILDAADVDEPEASPAVVEIYSLRVVPKLLAGKPEGWNMYLTKVSMGTIFWFVSDVRLRALAYILLVTHKPLKPTPLTLKIMLSSEKILHQKIWYHLNSGASFLLCRITSFVIMLSVYSSLIWLLPWEHLWPRSYGLNNGSSVTDLHNIRPADVNVNSSRGNKYYGECDVKSTTCLKPANKEASSGTETDKKRWAPPVEVFSFLSLSFFIAYVL